jgi:hypothetical protein
MDEERYWLIEVVDHTHAPARKIVDGYYLEYYPEGIEGAVAEVVFTDKERAERFAAQVYDPEHIEWRPVPVGSREELNQVIKDSVPKKTHVLLDPEYGKEGESLQPISWQ